MVRADERVVAGIPRTEVARAGPASTASMGIQAPSGIDRRREPAADSIVTQFAALARYVVALGAGHGPHLPSLTRFARRKRGRPSGRSHMMGEADTTDERRP